MACSNLTVSRGTPTNPSALPDRVYDLPAFLFGTISKQNVTEQEACPSSRIDWMRLRMDGGDVGLAILTLGIYVPQRVEIRCARN